MLTSSNFNNTKSTVFPMNTFKHKHERNSHLTCTNPFIFLLLFYDTQATNLYTIIEIGVLGKDVKSRMCRDVVTRVARHPATLDEMEVNGNELAYDTGRFIRYPSAGDGNCSFRSYSQGIARHQGLHVIFRKGTTAWMRAHPHLYKHPAMQIDAFREYLAEEVEVVGTDVGMDVAQGAADLLRTRMVRTFGQGPKVTDETTPFDGRCFYEINLACILGHVDTLARSHIYPYHLQGP